jgi:hypothetical protein
MKFSAAAADRCRLHLLCRLCPIPTTPSPFRRRLPRRYPRPQARPRRFRLRQLRHPPPTSSHRRLKRRHRGRCRRKCRQLLLQPFLAPPQHRHRPLLIRSPTHRQPQHQQRLHRRLQGPQRLRPRTIHSTMLPLLPRPHRRPRLRPRSPLRHRHRTTHSMTHQPPPRAHRLQHRRRRRHPRLVRQQRIRRRPRLLLPMIPSPTHRRLPHLPLLHPRRHPPLRRLNSVRFVVR